MTDYKSMKKIKSFRREMLTLVILCVFFIPLCLFFIEIENNRTYAQNKDTTFNLNNKNETPQIVNDYEKILKEDRTRALTQEDEVSLHALAKENGDMYLYSVLALIYMTGVGNISMDLDKSIKLYNDIALRGDFVTSPTAFYELGEIYSNRKFDKYDEKKAIKNYKISANRGFFPAQYALAEFYEKGLGTKKDYIKAYIWYSIAKENGGGEFAENRKDALSDNISQDDILKVQSMINEQKSIINKNIQKKY